MAAIDPTLPLGEWQLSPLAEIQSLRTTIAQGWNITLFDGIRGRTNAPRVLIGDLIDHHRPVADYASPRSMCDGRQEHDCRSSRRYRLVPSAVKLTWRQQEANHFNVAD